MRDMSAAVDLLSAIFFSAIFFLCRATGQDGLLRLWRRKGRPDHARFPVMQSSKCTNVCDICQAPQNISCRCSRPNGEAVGASQGGLVTAPEAHLTDCPPASHRLAEMSVHWDDSPIGRSSLASSRVRPSLCIWRDCRRVGGEAFPRRAVPTSLAGRRRLPPPFPAHPSGCYGNVINILTNTDIGAYNCLTFPHQLPPGTARRRGGDGRGGEAADAEAWNGRESDKQEEVP